MFYIHFFSEKGILEMIQAEIENAGITPELFGILLSKDWTLNLKVLQAGIKRWKSFSLPELRVDFLPPQPNHVVLWYRINKGSSVSHLWMSIRFIFNQMGTTLLEQAFKLIIYLLTIWKRSMRSKSKSSKLVVKKNVIEQIMSYV